MLCLGVLLGAFRTLSWNFRGRDWPADKRADGEIAIADLNNDGKGDVITTPGTGRAPEVRVFNGATAALIGSFNAYEPSFTGGATIAMEDLDGDGKLDLITGAGASGGPHVRAFSGFDDPIELRSFFAFDPGFTGGVFMG